MRFRCLCGNTLSNAGSPNGTEHLLIDGYAIEHLQNLVNAQTVASKGATNEWTENWEDSGATEVWKCDVCKRLYFSPSDGFENVVVYKIEKVGLE